MRLLDADLSQLDDAIFPIFASWAGINHAEAIGTVLLFLHATRKAQVSEGDMDTLAGFIPGDFERSRGLVLSMGMSGLVQTVPDQRGAPSFVQTLKQGPLRIMGNAEALAGQARRFARAQKAGLAGKKRAVRKPAAKKTQQAPVVSNLPAVQPAAPDKGPNAISVAFAAYADAFEARFKSRPPFNAKTAGQLKQLVARIGADNAPHVLRFYVQHTSEWYMKRMYPIGCALQDAEGLLAQWRTQTPVTEGMVRQASSHNSMAQLLQDIETGKI
jgi:hypothetical protein